MQGAIRVLVVDDHFVVRKGVCALLVDAEDIVVAGEVGDGQEAVRQALLLKPQVVLMDLKLPLLDGVEATRTIVTSQPEVRVLVMTGTGGDAQVLAALEAGALGYLAKTVERDELLAAIRRVAKGELWLPPRLTRKLLAHVRVGAGGVAPEPLTKREMAVLRLLAKGRNNQQISQELNISDATVRTHVSHVLGKLGVRNRVEAALYALRTGLAALEEP